MGLVELDGQGGGVVVVGEGLVGLVGGAQGLAEAVVGFELCVAVANVVGDGEGLLEVVNGLLVAPYTSVGLAKC
jgi:hypothetical protein